MNKPIIIRDMEQGTDEWLDMRAGVVSGTGFKKVLAKGRGETPSVGRFDYLVQLATERITGKPADETPVSFWMRRGTELEPLARALYEFDSGNDVDQCAFVYLNKHKRIGVSPDGLIGEDGLWEAKCPKLTTHARYLLDERRCPPAYVAQVQGQLWVTGRKWCDVCSFSELSHIKLMTVRVWRDEEYIDSLADSVSDFLTDLDSMERKLRKVTA